MIKLKGVIGLDVNGVDFADLIQRLTGDVEIEIDSPGGVVLDGITIFNAIRRYDKGKVNIQVVGECSSIAAYIMLAGDTLKFEPNSIVVLHNPWSVVCGDYRIMQHRAQILEKLTYLYAGEFVKKGIFSKEEIIAAMNEERWFIGEKDLKLLGEVIERNDTPKLKEKEKALLVDNAKKNITAWQTRLIEDSNITTSKIEALYKLDKEIEASLNFEKTIQGNTKNTQQSPKQEEENSILIQNQRKDQKMNLNEIKAQHPDLYSEILKEGKETEQARVKALLTFIEDDKESVIAAINDGKTIQDQELFAKLTRAQINKNTIKAMQEDNPPAVDPKAPEFEKTQEEENEENAKQKEAKEKAQIDEIIKYCGY